MNIPQLPAQRLPHQATTTRTFLFLFASIGCLISMLLALSPNTSYAATITVTNTNNSGPGSLQQTIADATAGDTITFDTSLSGQTIVLSDTLTIDKNLTIDGSMLTAPPMLSGNQQVRVMLIQQGATVLLSELVIAHSQLLGDVWISGSGGSLVNHGKATINRVTFTNNHADVNANPYISNNSQIGGGAIRNNGTMTITQSLFQSNSANNNAGGLGAGGAIDNGGQLLVQQSTFVDNYTHGYFGGQGSAIFNSGTLVVQNSTFSHNSAVGDFGRLGSGSGIANRGKVWVYNSTFSSNTAAAIANADQKQFHLYNTLIAHTSGSVGCLGTLTTNIRNLIEDGSCSASIVGDANLGILTTHDSPTGHPALLYVLQPGSPALDTGDAATCLATDQRGVERPQRTACDIGAYEAEPVGLVPEISVQGNGWSIADGAMTPSPTNHTAFGVVPANQGRITRTFTIRNLGQADLTKLSINLSSAHAADFSITQFPSPIISIGGETTFQLTFAPIVTGTRVATIAIDSNVEQSQPFTFAIGGESCPHTIAVTNNADSGAGSLPQALTTVCPGGIITFATPLSGQVILLRDTLIINKDLTIDGSGLENPVTLSGGGNLRVITITKGVAVALNYLAIADGYVVRWPEIVPPWPPRPQTDGVGGGLVNNGLLTINSVTFTHNLAGGGYRSYGSSGAIQNNGVLTITNSAFLDNFATDGGGITNAGRIIISASTFTGNSSGSYGGGYGGALANYGQMQVQNSTFFNNRANNLGRGYGGAIFNAAALTVTNSTFTGNGAGVYAPTSASSAIANQGSIWVYNSTFNANSAPSLDGTDPATGKPNNKVFHLYNTIVANSIGGPDCAGLLTTNINNLIEDGSCGAAFSGDPLLGPLVDYGGATFTQALLPGSPAIDTGDNTTCPATDQRGVVRPFDGDNNGSARCDIGAYEAVTPVLATATATATPTFTPTPIPPPPTNTPPPTHTPTITHTPTPTATPIPTGTPTSTGMPTFTPTATRFVPPLPTGEHHFDVRVYVVSSAAVVHVGETVTVTVTVDNQSIGCIYPVYTLMLSQVGDPIFHFASPTTVSEPLGEQTIYTLTAIATGAVALQATATGEQFCGAYWQPSSINGATYPVTVLAQVTPTPTAIPTITITPTIPTTPTILPTATQTITMTARRGDSNGDEVIDGADIVACIQEIFDNDGTLSQDAPGGSYVTGSSCDTNQDAVIDAGDISCTGLLRVDGQHLCGADTDQNTGQTVATLIITGDRTGTGGATVQLPISLNTNGAPVTAAAFRLQFDAAYLSFDPSDHNGDALPDALTLIQPPWVSQPLLTVTMHSNALDIALTDLATPPGSWYDGVFFIVNLRVHEVSGSAPLTTTVAFAPSVPPSLGSASGTSLPVQAVNGVVRLLPAAPLRQYLPLITTSK